MSIKDNWLANFRRVVESEVTATGKERAAYKAIATKTGLSEEYIYQVFKGKPKADGSPRYPGEAAAAALARAYRNEGQPKDWFDRPTSDNGAWDGNVVDGPDVKGIKEYPLISYVQAGEWTEIVDRFQTGDAVSWHISPKPLGNDGFVLRVEGHSMTNPSGSISFPEGMLIYINPSLDTSPGDFVVAKRASENQATFKKLVQVDGELYLHAINPTWPTPYIKLAPSDRIIGKLKHAGWDF